MRADRGQTSRLPLPPPGVSVAVVGGATLDVIARPTEILHPHRSTPGRVRLSPGGAGRNVAVNLARLGVPVRLIAGVPDDPGGRWLTAQTARSGVDVSGVTPIGDRGNYYVALVNQQDVLWAVSDLSAAEALAPSAVDVRAESIRGATLVVVDANLLPQTIQRVVELAAGKRICMLATSPAKANRLREVRQAASLLVVSTDEAETLVGRSVAGRDEALRAGRQLRNTYGTTVIITMGIDGLGWVADEELWVPAQATTVIDPTGAGDAVAAIAIYSLLCALDAHTAAELALAAGAMTVGVEGATHPELSLAALQAHG